MTSWLDRSFGTLKHDDPVRERGMLSVAQRYQDSGYTPTKVVRYEWQKHDDCQFLGASLPVEVLVEIDFEPGVTARTFADWWAENKIPLQPITSTT